MRFFNYFLFWLLLVPIAVGNGAFRQFVILPRTSELTAHQLSCLTGILLFAIYNVIIVKLWKNFPENPVPMGLFWILLTILFEFGLGRALGKEWSVLFHDYNILAGRLWVFVLLWAGAAPVVIRKLLKG